MVHLQYKWGRCLLGRTISASLKTPVANQLITKEQLISTIPFEIFGFVSVYFTDEGITGNSH